ncbi:sulfate adenylyltransferase subunit 1 [Candidatus Phycosocius spiralis]|uniref:sulfate adenylyltransferase n=1 Tax=Candidatus Phycosocius spiralis TaxID=2815099 RepID=A0ABQ4PUU2_9PROT|nr:GTP-binding protein [Candidatus Phycosocius spiralis]GIU66654.1 sulfate adenylyltransferase subunit 1 [Candidatus Phycosocius spiralis]
MSMSQSKLVRFVTAGNVDDGKSTLIGRILHDSKALLSDQVQSIVNARFGRADAGEMDLAFLTDGLESEREQGITIDVAYRYFTTQRASFIVIDAPGHEQYTRNMVTGASNADIAVVLVDASRIHQGHLKVQTRRHATIAHILGLKIVFAVNKMDLIDWSHSHYQQVEASLIRLSRTLGIEDIDIVPINARSGDNVVHQSAVPSWYQGPCLLQILEQQDKATDFADLPFRFPVQRVVRTNGHTLAAKRGYAGRIASGQIRLGDEVCVATSQQCSRIAKIETYDQILTHAQAGQSITLYTQDDLDIARGDCLTSSDARVTNLVVADLCWLDDQAWQDQQRYILRQGTASTPVRIQTVLHVRDMHDLSQVRGEQALAQNDIALVKLQTQSPIIADEFATNPKLGAFILINVDTNQTVAAGMIRNS